MYPLTGCEVCTRDSWQRTLGAIRAESQKRCETCSLIYQAAALIPRTAINEPEEDISLYGRTHNLISGLRDRDSASFFIMADQGSYNFDIYPTLTPENENYHSMLPPLKRFEWHQMVAKIPSGSNSNESHKFLVSHYLDYLKNRPVCRQALATLPKRVVDISRPLFWLVETDQSNKEPYAILSYCWGRHLLLTTTKET
jgi:hypothetical protein